MSLPPAPKDISDKPAPGSVVDPVNKAEKDADVDRKIRLYGVIEAFRQGRMPSNEQIDETLTYINHHSLVDKEKLSPNGQKLVTDVRQIIETARVIVKEKNADEVFQNFVWHTRDVDISTFTKDQSETSSSSTDKDKEKDKVTKDNDHQAVRHLRTILSLILTNSEVRKLLSDFSLIGRDLLARGASKVSEGLRPDPEKLVHVDDAAPQDQFVSGEEGSKLEEALLGRTDKTSVAANGVGGEEGLETGKVMSDQPGRTNKTSVAANGVGGEEGLEKGKVMSDQPGKMQEEDRQVVTNGVTTTTEKKQGLFGKVREIKDGLGDMIPQQHKDTAHGQLERGRHFLAEEYFPEERRDQFIYRGKKVIIECQKHEDYQDSIRWLLSYLETYINKAKEKVVLVTTETEKETHKTTKDPAFKNATAELRTLLERFANGMSIDEIVKSVNVLVDDAHRDQEFMTWSRKVNAYIRKVLLQPGFVLEPLCNTEGNQLRESGHQYYDDKYKPHFDDLFSTVGDWFKAMGEDPLNKRFGEDWARLTRDLLFDSEGSLKFKPDLWMDIRTVILPTLADKVGYIPIPRIEYTDDSLDLIVENLTLSGRNLFPNIVTIEAHNFLKFSPYSKIKDESHHEFTFTFAQMQADMRDVAFYYKMKTGLRLKDSGMADIVLGGSGLTATVHLVSSDKDKSSVFKVKSVNVKVENLKFSIRDAKYDFLYKTLKPIAAGLVKKQIQKVVAGAIKTGMEYVDGQLVSVRDRMAEAKEREDQSRTQVLQDLFKHHKEEEHPVKSNDRHSQFKVVSNKRQSLLGNAGNLAGWMNRTSEKDDKALQGEEWRSEAFHIV